MVLNPRFGYGRDHPWVRGDGVAPLLTAGPDSLCLRSSVALDREPGAVTALFDVARGEAQTFQLAWFPSHEAQPAALDVASELERTEEFWTDWAGRMTYDGKHRDPVMRSVLTLKALTFEPTGAIVAAPTSSLPEEIGGSRNWDYRFCWLRDATLTLSALMFAGYVEEAGRFRDWLLRSVAGDPDDTQIMYSIYGARRLTEVDIPWLPGYEGSSPVRMGNAASDQFQLDTYGEVANALYTGRRLGLPWHAEGWQTGRALMRRIADVWQHPDDGIWEVRGGRRQFVYSKVMAWVAVDRAVRIIEELGTGGEEDRAALPRLRALRERIHEETCARGFNPHINAFSQSYGSEALDASVLLIPHFGFLPADDPRMLGTVAAIEKDLVRDGFVLRYSTETGADGLPGSEGAFLACSFWLADNYAMAGRMEEAEELFDRLLGLRNHLGLLAEEYEPRLQRQIGNFPQGFSHLALVTTARVLDMKEAVPA
jgi:GH15 family glucan-1,4-alpha-glucosidase